jgi:hypothetical protein
VEYAINGVLEISNGKIQVVSYEDDQLLDFFVSDDYLMILRLLP